MTCRALTWVASDHCPMLLSCQRKGFRGPRPFNFLSDWVDHPNFQQVVLTAWGEVSFLGDAMHVLHSKLKHP